MGRTWFSSGLQGEIALGIQTNLAAKGHACSEESGACREFVSDAPTVPSSRRHALE